MIQQHEGVGGTVVSVSTLVKPGCCWCLGAPRRRCGGKENGPGRRRRGVSTLAIHLARCGATRLRCWRREGLCFFPPWSARRPRIRLSDGRAARAPRLEPRRPPARGGKARCHLSHLQSPPWWRRIGELLRGGGPSRGKRGAVTRRDCRPAIAPASNCLATADGTRTGYTVCCDEAVRQPMMTAHAELHGEFVRRDSGSL